MYGRGDRQSGTASTAVRWLIGTISPLVLAVAINGSARAQRHRDLSSLPSTTITSDETSPAAEAVAPPLNPAAPIHHPRPAPHHESKQEDTHTSVEPAHATLKLKQDAWAYAHPDTSSHAIERVHAGNLVDVTGTTHFYAQAKLKDGTAAYVPLSALDLTRPEDKMMRLSTNAAVLSLPNHYGKKLSEVHQGHDVHVIGIALNYVKIRMKSGLEGFIPATAAE